MPVKLLSADTVNENIYPINLSVTVCVFYLPRESKWTVFCYDFIGGSKGGAAGAHPPPPHGIQFFRFCIHFHRKAPPSEVSAPPQRLGAPPQREILDPPLDLIHLANHPT